jgi:hypothetical protein
VHRLMRISRQKGARLCPGDLTVCSYRGSAFAYFPIEVMSRYPAGVG